MANNQIQVSISVQSKVDKVKAIVQDPSYTDAVVLGIFNDLLLDISGGIEIVDNGEVRISPPLPDLFTNGTFTADKDSAYASMPANYQRGLWRVVNADGRSLKLFYDNVNAILVFRPRLNLSGPVTMCALRGRNLYYQGIPTSDETLTVYYHRVPLGMTLADTSVDGLPDFLVHRLLVNGACYRIYDEIEDGTEGNKTSTRRYEELFRMALISLEKWIPVDGDSMFINKCPLDTGAYIY